MEDYAIDYEDLYVGNSGKKEEKPDNEIIAQLKELWKTPRNRIFMIVAPLVFVAVFGGIIVMQFQGHKATPPGDSPGAAPPPASTGKSTFPLLNFFSHSQKPTATKSQVTQQSSSQTGSGSTTSPITIAPSAKTNDTQTRSGVGAGTLSNGSSSTNQTGSSVQSGTSGGSQQTGGITNVQIIFQDPSGNTTTYTPPDTPPVQVDWATYTNSQDHYSIEYPHNWQVVKINYNNHEGLSIFPPGANINDINGEHIGLGVSISYQLPGNPYPVPIIVDGLHGVLYTAGTLGESYIASLFTYRNEYFGLGSSVSTPDFIYIYSHMINSLRFNI